MENKLEQIGIALILPDDISVKLREIQTDLAKKFSVVNGFLQPAHITLKRPFEVTDISKFKEYCNNLANTVKPVKVDVNGFGNFGTNVIFFNVLESNELTNLHLDILKDLNSKFDISKGNFEGDDKIFHITVAFNDLSEDNFNLVKDSLPNNLNLNFVCDELAILRFNGLEWVIEEKFKLRN